MGAAITPTIHLNGTGAETLKRNYNEAAEALEDFIAVWGQIEFNARDYYVDGPDAWTVARTERDQMGQRIREVKEYLQAIRESLYDQAP